MHWFELWLWVWRLIVCEARGCTRRGGPRRRERAGPNRPAVADRAASRKRAALIMIFNPLRAGPAARNTTPRGGRVSGNPALPVPLAGVRSAATNGESNSYRGPDAPLYMNTSFYFPRFSRCDEPPPGIRTPDAPALEPDTSPATGTAADGSARPSQSWQPQPPMPRPSPPSLPVDGHFHKSQTSHNVAVCHPVSFLVSTPCIVARRQSA